MMQLNNTCLTIKQAKELQSLGIDFRNTILCYYGIAVNERSEIIKDIVYKLDFRYIAASVIDEVPTLTVSEMIEMLPKEINGFQLKIVPCDYGYCVKYELHARHIIYVGHRVIFVTRCFFVSLHQLR